MILPLSLHDGKWHHVCVTWLARDGVWEVYQDGTKRGSGDNLNAWQPIKPGGVFILGQEQVTHTHTFSFFHFINIPDVYSILYVPVCVCVR